MAISNDTAREFVRVAQLPALVCVWNKQCWIVKFTHQNSWKKKSGQMVVSQPSRVASLQTRLKRLIQKGGHTVKCLACGGDDLLTGQSKGSNVGLKVTGNGDQDSSLLCRYASFSKVRKRSKSLSNSLSCTTRYFSNSLSANALAISWVTRPVSWRISCSLNSRKRLSL